MACSATRWVITGLSRGFDGDDADLRQDLRHLRPQVAVHARDRCLPGGLDAVGHRPVDGAAHRLPSSPGCWRRDDDAYLAGHRRRHIPAAERGKYQGLLGAVFGLAVIIGPGLGGWITDNATWRWVFYVNVPFAIAALGVVFLVLPNETALHKRHSIDWAGSLALILGGGAPADGHFLR